MGVAHLAVDLGFGDHCGYRVDDDAVDSAGACQRLSDLESLLAAVRLRYQHAVDVHAQLSCVEGVEGVLNVDERHLAAQLLGLGDAVERNGGLARGFRSVQLDDASAGDTADAECQVEGHGAGGYRLDIQLLVCAQLHDSALAELLFDVLYRGIKSLFLLLRVGDLDYCRLALIFLFLVYCHFFLPAFQGS